MQDKLIASRRRILRSIRSLMVFSYGGLIVMINFLDGRAEVISDWKEEIATLSMKVIADITRKMAKYGRNFVVMKRFIVVTKQNCDYILIVGLKTLEATPQIIAHMFNILDVIKDLPENPDAISEEILKYFGFSIL